MVFDDVMGDLNQIVSILPSDVSNKVLDLVVILKALGIAVIFYFVYVVIMGLLTYRRMKKIEHIEKKADDIGKKVNSIDKKLNKLLKKKD